MPSPMVKKWFRYNYPAAAGLYWIRISPGSPPQLGELKPEVSDAMWLFGGDPLVFEAELPTFQWYGPIEVEAPPTEVE